MNSNRLVCKLQKTIQNNLIIACKTFLVFDVRSWYQCHIHKKQMKKVGHLEKKRSIGNINFVAL